MSAAVPQVVLVGKPGCHLCDDGREVVAAVCADLGLPWSERSVLDDPALYDEYAEQIPVVLVDGVIHDHWLIDADRLRLRLSE